MTKDTEEESGEETLVETDSDRTIVEASSASERPLPLKELAALSNPSLVTTSVTLSPTTYLPVSTGRTPVTVKKEKTLPDFSHRDLYLPIPGAPSINQLEPVELKELTHRGNRAKRVKISLWHHKYQVSYYAVDDITGEIYAMTSEGLIAIRECAYLDKQVALEAALVQFPGESSKSTDASSTKTPDQEVGTRGLVPDNINPPLPTPIKEPKSQPTTPTNPTSPTAKDDLFANESRTQVHQRVTREYKAMRAQRKKLEAELMHYEVPGKEPGNATEQEIARERFYAKNNYEKALDRETPLFKLYLETIPSDQEDDTLSLSSLDSYEAQEDWTEPKYRKLMFKYERGQKYYSVLESCRNAEVARDPTQATACNRELMVSREELDQRQKKGANSVGNSQSRDSIQKTTT